MVIVRELVGCCLGLVRALLGCCEGVLMVIGRELLGSC